MDKILDELGLNNPSNKLKALFSKVRKNPTPATVQTRNPGYIYQADLLFLPNDGGNKYCLTVVDTNNHAVDAEPLKSKNPREIVNAFEKIFKRKYLPLPKYSVETDPGGEFKNDTVANYLNKNKIFLRIGTSGRSNQQSVVEHYNGLIATLLFKLMTVDELTHGIESHEWVESLPKIIELLNKYKTKKKQREEIDVLATSTEDIIPIGTSVRYALDKPRNVIDEKRLHGKLRATDVRWSLKPSKIKFISLRPDQPVLYELDNVKSNFFTRNQLQLIEDDEKLPVARKQEVVKILKKFKKNGRVAYTIKFDDGDIEDQFRTKLIKEIPDLIAEFEKKNSK
jgi:hypothetical protein